MRVRCFSVAFALYVFVSEASLCASQVLGSQGPQAPQTAPLRINVLDLPEGAAARVNVSSAAGSVGSLAKAGIVSVLPGRYTVNAAPVHYGNATYYPTVPTQEATVAGGASTVTVDYYDIVPDSTKVLDVEGERTLVVSGGGAHISIGGESVIARSLKVGDVLAVGPTATTSLGLLARVVAVRSSGDRIEAEVRRASFMEAVTRGRVSGGVTYSPRTMRVRKLVGDNRDWLSSASAKSMNLLGPGSVSGAGCSGANPAVVLPFDYTIGGQASVSIGPVGAGGSVGLELSGATTLCPNLTLNVDWGFLHINSAEVVATLGEDTTVTASAQDSVSVDVKVDVLEVQTPPFVIVVAGVPVVLAGDATLTLGGSLEADSSFSASTTEAASAEIGLSYKNGSVAPIHDASFSIQPAKIVRNASITGKASVGLKLGVLVDEVLLPNVEPEAYLSWNPSPPATLSWGLQGTVGIDVQVADHVVVSASTPKIDLIKPKMLWQASAAQTKPTLNLVTPNNAPEGSSRLTLTLSGYDFPVDSVVMASGKPLKTSPASSKTLWATLPAAQMLRTGTVQISVVDPSSGATSSALPFTVTPVNQGPVITGLNPWSVPAGSPAQNLTVFGENFRSGSTASFNSESRPVTYLSNSKLTVALTAGDLKNAGEFPIVVTDPSPDGGPSSPMNFAVLSTSPGRGDWTWMSGSDVVNQIGIYGKKGTPSAENVPGARWNPVSWIDTNGRLWLFGGEGEASTGYYDYLNDLWEFDPSGQVWTWVSGSNTGDKPGSYGQEGVPSATNVPGARWGAESWADGSGNLWLFGGWGKDSAGNSGLLNDLWQFSAAYQTWIWMSGSNAAGQPGVYGSQGVPTPANVPSPREGAITWIDAGDNLWMFGGESIASPTQVGTSQTLTYDSRNQLYYSTTGYFNGYGTDNNNLYFYCPNATPGDSGFPFVQWENGESGALRSAPYTIESNRIGELNLSAYPNWRNSDIEYIGFLNSNWQSLPEYCGPNTTLGNTYDSVVPPTDFMLNDLWEFSPTSQMWTWVSGSSAPDQPGVYGQQGAPLSRNVPGARRAAVSWIDAIGNLWLFGGWGVDSAGSLGYLNDLWRFNPESQMWTWISGSDIAGPSGTYGQLEFPSSVNSPGGRWGAASWADSSGNFWLFGGKGLDSTGSEDDLNDLWQFDPATRMWAWISGSSRTDELGSYGALRDSSSTSVPGARDGAETWFDRTGNLWLFGGVGLDSHGTLYYLNDLWEYKPK